MTRTRRLAAVLGLSLALAGMAAPALASWGVGSSGASGSATAGSILAPATVSTTAQTSTTITLKVVAGPGSGGTPASFRVDRTVGTSPGPATGVCTVSAVGGTCDDTGLTPSTSYSYVIRSILDGWVSGPSSTIATATTAPPAAATSVSPSSRGQNSAAVTVTITGTGFTSGASLNANFGANTTTTAVTFVNSTTITASVAVAAGAATGVRSFTVTNGSGGTLTCTNCFTVNAAPTISSATPSQLTHGTTTTVTLAGTGFINGLGIVSNDSKYVIGAINVSSSTSLTVSVQDTYTNSGTNAATLTVTNPDGGRATVGITNK